MSRCETCGNDYDRAFSLSIDGRTHTFDCFECAIHKLAPSCPHCGCRVIGHGVEGGGAIYCCARAMGRTDLRDGSGGNGHGQPGRRQARKHARTQTIASSGPSIDTSTGTRTATFHVRSVAGGWEVVDSRGHPVSEPMRSQADAVVHAKDLARRAGGAQIVVSDEDGALASEFFYRGEEGASLA